MKNTGLICISFLLMSIQLAWGQAEIQGIHLKYDNEPLGDVLSDISEQHAVRFSYSSDFIPMDHPISINVSRKSMHEALDALFEPTPIVYANIGEQFVLRVDRKKRIQKVSTLTSAKKKVRQMSPIHPPSEAELQAARLAEKERIRKERSKYERMDPIHNDNPKEVSGGKRSDPELDDYRLPTFEYDAASLSGKRLAQISILPSVGTNLNRSEIITNNVSVNVFWGNNGGVEGLEVGGFVNSVSQDMKGVQIAGLGNVVGGGTVGTQTAGLFNVDKGKMQGLQAAGLFNISGETDAVQASGLFNISKGFTGIQTAGLFNFANGNSEGIQLASLFNVSKKDTRTQISGLANFGGDVSWGQASALLNVAGHLKGFQFGLINVADTVSGTPIGLLTIVRNGYNRVEFSTGDAFRANFALKLGAHSFYNIFQAAANWNKNELTVNGIIQQDVIMSWALGYGVGSTVKLGPKTLMNVEAVAMHVNETKRWTDKLNLLNQFRLLLDYRIGNRTSVYAGPVGNLMISKLYDAESNTYGSSLAPYTFYNETTNNTNVQAWVGFNAGIRF